MQSQMEDQENAYRRLQRRSLHREQKLRALLTVSFQKYFRFLTKPFVFSLKDLRTRYSGYIPFSKYEICVQKIKALNVECESLREKLADTEVQLTRTQSEGIQHKELAELSGEISDLLKGHKGVNRLSDWQATLANSRASEATLKREVSAHFNV